MPQPLTKFPRDRIGRISLGNNWDNPSDHRPQLALLAMKVVSDWSILESFLSGVFVLMLGANPRPAATMYSALASTGAQKSALRAVARGALSEKENEVFEALLSLFSSLAKERNKIVHWIWGFAAGIPDGVLLCDPEAALENKVTSLEANIAVAQAWEQLVKHGGDIHRHFEEHTKLIATVFDDRRELNGVLVYKSADFEGLRTRIQRLIGLITQFRLMLYRDHRPSKDGTILRKLLAEPEVRAFLDRQLERQKKSQEAQPPPPAEEQQG